MKTIILTGGGTGGHVYPNIALLPNLQNSARIVYVGGEGDTLERKIALASGLPYYGLPTIKLVRSFSPTAIRNNVKIPATLHNCIKSAAALITHLKPDVVFSKGGYAALPITLAAIKMKIPVICHESDLTTGLANKLAVRRGAILLTANPHAKSGEFVGMPLRRELFQKERIASKQKFGLSSDTQVLLAVGGSGGAKTINDLIVKHIPALTNNFFVIHLYGKNDAFSPPDPLPNNYMPLAYSDDMPSLYAAADIVVSRAGATAVFELAALSKKTVLIPLPKGISRGDQIYNAELGKEYGAQVLYQDEELDKNFMLAVRNALILPPMRKIADDSNGKIAEIINASMGRGDLCKNKKL